MRGFLRPLPCVLAFSACCLAAMAHDVDMTHLPLGDGKLSHGPRVGWIWACHVEPGAPGAERDGPWIDKRNGTWDATRKIAVGGAVRWPHQFHIEVRGDERVFSANDLPNHPTGIFPIRRSEPAYHYDRNPNHIASQHLRFALPAMPVLAQQPTCAPGAVGILLTGVVLFNALDEPGRDAVAHEIQDHCHGHPQQGSVYHYHNLTNCIDDEPDRDGHSKLVGYAIDGFGIFGNWDHGRRLTSADLDECHGHRHEIEWDGRRIVMYHYHATPDFPYTVGCLRGHYDRSIVRAISGPPPRRGPHLGPPGGPRRPGGPDGPPPFGGPPPRFGPPPP